MAYAPCVLLTRMKSKEKLKRIKSFNPVDCCHKTLMLCLRACLTWDFEDRQYLTHTMECVVLDVPCTMERPYQLANSRLLSVSCL